MKAIMYFIYDEDGLTVLEYIAGAALLAAGLTAFFTGYGTTLLNKLNAILASF